MLRQCNVQIHVWTSSAHFKHRYVTRLKVQNTRYITDHDKKFNYFMQTCTCTCTCMQNSLEVVAYTKFWMCQNYRYNCLHVYTYVESALSHIPSGRSHETIYCPLTVWTVYKLGSTYMYMCINLAARTMYIHVYKLSSTYNSWQHGQCVRALPIHTRENNMN